MKFKSFLQFTAPSNIVMITLMIIPLGLAVYIGFNRVSYSTFNKPVFVGFLNYLEVLLDPSFWEAVFWNLLIILVVVPAHIVIAFIAALILDQVTGRIRGIYLAAMLLPMIVVPVIGTVVFRQLFDPSGLIAWFFRVVLGERFLFNETSMKILILIHSTWISTPFALVIFFAGLQMLRRDLIDSASIDGANRIQQVWYVIIPQLRSLFLLNAIFAVMDLLRLFDNVFVLTRMNPIFHSDTMQTYLYRIAMTVKRLGKANAGAVLTVVIIMIVLIPLLIYLYREQVEER
ncbi:MAG: sugar ABC transporter permease [Candidatus Neomarinimicrobiota bacterium]|nr:sugar ABC transporter permease [Candidatus Neomarinimicrobiota bacterium]